MAKAFFINNLIRRENLSAMCLNDTQYQETKPLAYQAQFLSVEISDTDYNDFYKGKKDPIVNEDGTISAADLPATPYLQTEKEFEDHSHLYIGELERFKQHFPTHSKINEVQEVFNFVTKIDVTQLTFPHKNFRRYLIDNDKYIELNYI